jgi:hypothetical protein
MNILVLEDCPKRIAWFVKSYGNSHDLTICTTVEAFKSSYMAKCHTDLVFLDHDLGGKAFVDSDESNTGYRAAEHVTSFMEVQGSRPHTVIVHSLNPSGVSRILQALQPVAADGTSVIAAPFGTFKAGGW